MVIWGNMNAKIKRICAQLKKEHLDGLILTSPANISYLTDYPSRDSYLIISARQSVYLTDSRYTEEAKSRLKGVAVKDINGSLLKGINQVCRQLRLTCLGFEERNLSFRQYNQIRKELPDILDLVPTYGLVENLRQVKSVIEVGKIKQATRIAVQAFSFIQGHLKPGIKEIEVAGELERFIRYQGASGSSFNIIVASGPNSAYPHHITSERKLKANEPVLVDFGVDYCHYKSDLTRVFFLGKIDILAGKVYRIVRQAQELAIKAIKPGKTCGEIDGIARSYIASKGYGRFFGHGLGHGVGLEIHEGPQIGRGQNTRLAPGMVFTVEPAIYLPRKFGIRLEDMVLVTKKGSEVLSGALNK
jgi:Xaa-Pro aminopeptidase